MTIERNQCGLYRIGDKSFCNEGCFLKHLVEQQAKQGGNLNPSTDPDRREAGPHWPEEDWDEFCKKTKGQAERGCINREALGKTIEELTAEKKEKGHFF
jgi:hypothetical protein